MKNRHDDIENSVCENCTAKARAAAEACVRGQSVVWCAEHSILVTLDIVDGIITHASCWRVSDAVARDIVEGIERKLRRKIH